MLMNTFSLKAQKPVAYWSFENENVSVDEINKVTSQFRSSMILEETASLPENQDVRVPRTRNTKQIRKYIKLTRETSDNVYLNCGLNKEGFTLAFFFRLPPADYNPNFRLFWSTDYSFYTHFRTNSIQFSTRALDAEGKLFGHNLFVPLDGAGKKNYGYFLDGDWHHMVFKYDAKSGKKEVWIDGEIPEGWSTEVEQRGNSVCGDTNCKSQIILGHQRGSSEAFIGELDEVVLYDQYVDEDIHLQHYIQFWENANLKFRFNDYKYGQEIRRIKEFNIKSAKTSAGEILSGSNSEYPTSIESPEMEPLEQLQAYPSPRYKKGHDFLPLYSWVNYKYLAGTFRRFPLSVASLNSYHLQKELALNWNYSINLGNSVEARFSSQELRPDQFLYQWIKLANELPNVLCTVTTLWPQTILQDIGEDVAAPYVRRQDLPDDYYLRNTKGDFLNWNGGNFAGTRYITPSASGKLFKADGKAQNFYMNLLLKYLDRPIDWINENGEVYPYPYRDFVLEKDLNAVKEKEKNKFPDWDTYQAYKKTVFRKYYRDQMLKGISKSNNTIFTWYGIDGGDTPNNRFKWSEAKHVLTPIKGEFLSTTDFYPIEPRFWKTGTGPWHGWDWVEKTRKVEIMEGDHLCSPYVAAGWSKDPTVNIRPSQWLGLLKNLGVLGAEFYYVGFFNEGAWENYPDPRNYVWQMTTPAYAQALSSYYPEILREGKLLEDEKGEPIMSYWAGDPRVVVTIRKHSSKKQYVLAASLNPISNTANNVEEKKTISVNLEGEDLTFEVRKQGSVYMLDLTDSRNPLFWQLDSWHESGHPIHWSTSMAYEAEVYDHAQKMDRITYNINGRKDFSHFKTYTLSTSSNTEVSYEIPTRNFPTGSALLNLTAGMRESGTGIVDVLVNGKLVKTFEVESSSAKYDENGYPLTQLYSCGLEDLGDTPVQLSIKCRNAGILLDNFVVSPVSGISE